ncbi:MAG: hypothetical protein K2L83_01930 [Muribaculaceae bacterium]|nr:hypothetical protein [Muribaculaceae bacterium]
MDFSFSDLNFNSVENLPGFEARAAFTVNSASVFREDVDIVPTIIDDKLSYVPWGGDNQMPFDLLALVEKDETLATCQCFNAEVCYGSGLQYCTTETTAKVKNDVEDYTKSLRSKVICTPLDKFAMLAPTDFFYMTCVYLRQSVAAQRHTIRQNVTT